MRWPWMWRKHEPSPVLPPAVTDEQRAELQRAQEFLASQTATLDAQLPEIRRVARYLRVEQERNHLAEKFRIAFGGAHDRRH